MTRTDKNRVLWVERAQVISMLLVVLHHCVPHGYDGPEWLPGLLNAIQYPALVCFFLTSGLFATKWKARGWAAYMKRRCLRLLPPYFCVNLLMLLPTTFVTLGGYFIANSLLYDTGAAIAELLPNLIQATASGVIFVAVGLSLDSVRFKARVLRP